MTPAITDISGLLVGHAHDGEALTGCTVVLPPPGTVGGVDVRGGAPGTRETDLLSPTMLVSEVHAVALCGGSAFGLAAATGVMQWLHERGIGFQTAFAPVPIVPAAVIFDLGLGSASRWPDTAMGYAACEAASTTTGEGCVGVGVGASVGKVGGNATAMKCGVGSWSETLPDGTVIGALVVCNAFGDVWRDAGANSGIIAGARDGQGGFANTMRLLRQGIPGGPLATAALSNTTLAVVATNASLNKAEATKLAQMAHDGLARTIRPVHTPFDGDTIFTLATRQRPALPLALLGGLAAEVLARAVERSASEATSLGGLPAARDMQR
ncbi:MAG: P1 family peptidase [Chloroflexaceae bacterium]|jgi:L-aminopeptidase/D-esterase-like protein|nr:P1 family peptidase [Chloroflexaceae bacterium]